MAKLCCFFEPRNIHSCLVDFNKVESLNLQYSQARRTIGGRLGYVPTTLSLFKPGEADMHCKPIPVMKTGFSLCSISHREKPVFITWEPCIENRFFPVWKYYTGKTLFWPCTGPVRDCSVYHGFWIDLLCANMTRKRTPLVDPFFGNTVFSLGSNQAFVSRWENMPQTNNFLLTSNRFIFS